jgi:general secretion pathway protein J
VTRQRAPSESGFTLVEMMVALAIFSMISVAGVALLQSASRSQLIVKDRLADMSETSRAIAMIESDLAQAIARPVRSASAPVEPAFVAGGPLDGQIFAATRGGQSNLDNAPRADLQRVAYVLEKGELRRTSWSMLDGGTPRTSVLLRDVSSATTRFREADGDWRNDWDAADPLALPRALELIIVQKGAAPLRLLFLVGTGGFYQPAKPREEWQG